MARCWGCVWRGVLMVVVFCFSCCRPQGPARNGKFITHLLEGTSNVHMVECTDRDIVAMNISYAGQPLISVDMRKQGTCKTSRGLAACVLKDGLVTAKVFVTDLEEGQTRKYGCRISKFLPHGQETVTTEYYVSVTQPIATTTKGTTSMSRTSVSTTTEKAATMPPSSDGVFVTVGFLAGAGVVNLLVLSVYALRRRCKKLRTANTEHVYTSLRFRHGDHTVRPSSDSPVGAGIQREERSPVTGVGVQGRQQNPDTATVSQHEAQADEAEGGNDYISIGEDDLAVDSHGYLTPISENTL